jgi:hypothetical protein
MFAASRHNRTAAPASTAATMMSNHRWRGSRTNPTINATTAVSAAVNAMCRPEKTMVCRCRVSRRAAG